MVVFLLFFSFIYQYSIAETLRVWIERNLLQLITRSNLALSRRLGRFRDIASSRALVIVLPQTALMVLKHQHQQW